MKKALYFIVVIVLMLTLSSCSFHFHKWEEATCTEPAICSVCGQTKGEAKGHEWVDATCTEPKTCIVCGLTEGYALGHDAKGLSCTNGAKCTRCNEMIPKLGHDWSEPTCTEPRKCSRCDSTLGEPLGYHDIVDGKCTYCSIPLVTKEDIDSGEYANKKVIVCATVMDFVLDDHNRVSFKVWIPDGNTFYIDDEWTIYDEPTTAYLKKVWTLKSGDVIRFTTKVHNDSSFGYHPKEDFLEIIDNTNPNELLNNAYNNAPGLDYNDVMRNPDAYTNKNRIATFSGKVFQVIDDDTFLVDTSAGIVYLHDRRNAINGRILEGDYIECYGEIDGTTDYSTLIGKKEVPLFWAYDIR